MAKIVDKAKKQSEIVQAALKVFINRGYQGATVKEIADCAGVSKGLLYVYFKNKEDLFAAVFNWFDQMTGETMEKALSQGGNAIDQLKHISKAWADIVSEYRDCAPLFLDYWAAANHTNQRAEYAEDLSHLYENYRQLLAGIIDEGKVQGVIKNSVDTEAVVFFLIGSMDGIFVQSWLTKTFEVKGMFLKAFDVFIDGLANR